MLDTISESSDCLLFLEILLLDGCFCFLHAGQKDPIQIKRIKLLEKRILLFFDRTIVSEKKTEILRKISCH